VISTNVHLREVALKSCVFEGGHPFTTVQIGDAAGNVVSLFVNAETADAAIALADAIRAAAHPYRLGEAQPVAVEAVA
jgi:hypothetical protein